MYLQKLGSPPLALRAAVGRQGQGAEGVVSSYKKRIKMNYSPIPPIIWRAGMVVKAPLFSKRM
jgi:hypothetical protein